MDPINKTKYILFMISTLYKYYIVIMYKFISHNILMDKMYVKIYYCISNTWLGHPNDYLETSNDDHNIISFLNVCNVYNVNNVTNVCNVNHVFNLNTVNNVNKYNPIMQIMPIMYIMLISVILLHI